MNPLSYGYGELDGDTLNFISDFFITIFSPGGEFPMGRCFSALPLDLFIAT